MQVLHGKGYHHCKNKTETATAIWQIPVKFSPLQGGTLKAMDFIQQTGRKKNHEKNGAVKSLKLTDGSLTIYKAIQSAVLPLEEGKRLVLNLLGSDSAFLGNVGILDFWHTAVCFFPKKFTCLSPSFSCFLPPVLLLVHLVWITETCQFCFLMRCPVVPWVVLAIQSKNRFQL